jgi:hypothetical protein
MATARAWDHEGGREYEVRDEASGKLLGYVELREPIPAEDLCPNFCMCLPMTPASAPCWVNDESEPELILMLRSYRFEAGAPAYLAFSAPSELLPWLPRVIGFTPFRAAGER